MKLKFKHQDYQTAAVEAVVDCFKGQPYIAGSTYRIDPGRTARRETSETGRLAHIDEPRYTGFENADLVLSDKQVLENIQAVQRRQNLPVSSALVTNPICKFNLDVEMETGTGKTYCYTKTFFEMNKRYGWSKFIIVVPNIAIREGVYKSLEITAEHFFQDYKKSIRFFIYDSNQLHNLESFSSDAGINVMVINIQAFYSRSKANLRIYQELDEFQSRRPIDVIKANRPILVLDEPQKMEGRKTLTALKEFNPLMVLRYSATHKTQHNKVFRLDALDAYNQKLVKKIAVRGITVKGLSGTNGYLYLEGIEISTHSPVARLELEVKQKSGNIRRMIKRVKKGDDLYTLSGELDQYRHCVISELNSDPNTNRDTVSFTNGLVLVAGEAVGNVNEAELRRIQIREAIRAHLEKERVLFYQGIKVLTLFFIDEVAKYRQYTDEGKQPGEYAHIFEEEYRACVADLGLMHHPEYRKYLEGIKVSETHDGYFAIDKNHRMVDPHVKGSERISDDSDAYDLILKKKERLLSMEEPVRFIFSHSALREGWDNPNVFVICALKHSDNTVSRRQEVGRGLRLCVNRKGERQDDPATVHRTNVLTVVASESYKDFVAALQKDITASLSERPRAANVEYFTGKLIPTDSESLKVTEDMARGIEDYLVQNKYVDRQRHLTEAYHQDVRNGTLSELPGDLVPHKEGILKLIESVYSEAALKDLIADDRAEKTNPVNHNFTRKEFQELWGRINHKAVYQVKFNTEELVRKCVPVLNGELKVRALEYDIVAGEQNEKVTYDDLRGGQSFKVAQVHRETSWRPAYTQVKYDLVGKICEVTQLTRRTVADILGGIEKPVFDQFGINPEHFIAEASRLINEQKATVIIEHLTYDSLNETHDIDIFTQAGEKQCFKWAGKPLQKHVYDYLVTDSSTERNFASRLDVSDEVVVYAKLPKAFFIPTPVGHYNPDWAIAFKEGTVQHVYFVAETKGSMSSMELRRIEELKIECAHRFFDDLNETNPSRQVRYDVVDSYDKLLEIVGSPTDKEAPVAEAN